jgi:hypothetical protein
MTDTHLAPTLIADADEAAIWRHVLFAAPGYAAGRQARPEAALADQIHAVMP